MNPRFKLTNYITVVMNEKQQILQCLIENRAFAPSASALAKDLGYESNKATIYRIMEGKTKDSTVDEVWNKLSEEHCLTNEQLYNLARIFEGAAYFSDRLLPEMNRKHPKWLRYLLLMLTDDDYEDCSPKFQQETAPVLKDLKADEPDVYWGIVTVIYMRCRQIDPYKLGIKRTFGLLIDELDEMLFHWYPERADAHETAFNLKELSYGSNLWKIIEYCVILFRRYTEPDFSKYASQIMRLFNWGEVSYWRTPDCPYRQGSEVWLFSEQNLGRATNGFYIVLRLEAGKDNRTFLLKDALNYCFWTIDEDDDPPILQASRGASTQKEWGFYLYAYDEENGLLHLEANPDTAGDIATDTYRPSPRQRREGVERHLAEMGRGTRRNRLPASQGTPLGQDVFGRHLSSERRVHQPKLPYVIHRARRSHNQLPDSHRRIRFPCRHQSHTRRFDSPT